MRSPELRVKIKSLAAESIIIRQEINRYRDNLIKQKLHLHRVHDVREEQRATLVAYAYLNGLNYADIEATSYKEPKWDRVRAMVRKYGPSATGGFNADTLVLGLEGWRATSRNNRGMFVAVLEADVEESV